MKLELFLYMIPGVGVGALQCQMDTGVRLTLPKAGAFGENTISKKEGSLDEKPNFDSKLGALGENVTFDLSVNALKAGI